MAWRSNNDPFACPGQDWPHDAAGDFYVPDLQSHHAQDAMVELLDILEHFANEMRSDLLLTDPNPVMPSGLDWHDACWFADLVGEEMAREAGLL